MSGKIEPKINANTDDIIPYFNKTSDKKNDAKK